MATSAMEAALSIISLVIFAAPCACACAHSTAGNSVPARPIPEHVFMKFRRCSILILPIVQSRRRARKISHLRFGGFAAFFISENTMGQSSADGPPFLFSRTKPDVVAFPHTERSFHDPTQEVFHFPTARASEFPSPASPYRKSRQPTRRGQRGGSQGRRYFSENFSGARFFSRPECASPVPQQRWGPLR